MCFRTHINVVLAYVLIRTILMSNFCWVLHLFRVVGPIFVFLCLAEKIGLKVRSSLSAQAPAMGSGWCATISNGH